jgi:hypothetical protein
VAKGETVTAYKKLDGEKEASIALIATDISPAAYLVLDHWNLGSLVRHHVFLFSRVNTNLR